MSDIMQVVGKSMSEGTFVLRGHHSGHNQVIALNSGSAFSETEMPVMPIVLESFGFEIITVTAIYGGVGFLGLVDKYNSLAGLASFGVHESTVTATFTCCGKAAFFIPRSARYYVEQSLLSEMGGFSFENVPLAPQGLMLFIELDERKETLTITFDIA
jgi:hypothetical protein